MSRLQSLPGKIFIFYPKTIEGFWLESLNIRVPCDGPGTVKICSYMYTYIFSHPPFAWSRTYKLIFKLSYKWRNGSRRWASIEKSFNFIFSVGNSTPAVFARHTFESRQRLIFFSSFLSPIPLIANHPRESFLCFQFIQRLNWILCILFNATCRLTLRPPL